MFDRLPSLPTRLRKREKVTKQNRNVGDMDDFFFSGNTGFKIKSELLA